jgi:hypothetical protein
MTEKDKKIIEDSEKAGIPIFVFTAKDICLIPTLREYQMFCRFAGCDRDHIDGVELRIREFKKWQAANPHLTKKPD